MENSCPCVPQNVLGSFRLVSATAALIRCFMLRLAPSGLRLRFPKFFRQCSDHFSDQFGDQFGDPFSDQFFHQFSNQFPKPMFPSFFFGLTSFAGMVAGRGGAGFFGRDFGGQGEVFGRRFACKRIAEFSLEWHGNLRIFLWLEGSERRSVKACRKSHKDAKDEKLNELNGFSLIVLR